MNEIMYPKYRWYVLITFVVATLAQGMLLIAPSPLVGEISKSLSVDLGVATAATMMPFTLLVAIGGIVGGILMDKFGLAKTFIFCTILSCVGAFLMPVAGTSVIGVIICRAIQGFGCGPIIASGPRVAAEWFPQKQRGLYQGIVGAALSLGITLGLSFGPAIAASSGWLTMNALFGIVMAVAVVMIVIYNFGPKSPVPMAAQGHVEGGDSKMIFKLPVFWLTVVAVFALSWVQQGYNDLTPGHIAVPEPAGLNMGAQAAGQIMGMYTLAFMFGSLVSGIFAEKVFRGKYKVAVTTTFIITAVFCASVLLPFVNQNMPVLMICLLIAGFFMGMPMPVSMTFIANSYPEQMTGRVGGISMGIAIFGGTIGVAAGSLALSSTGMYVVSILIVSTVAIVGALAAIGMNKPKMLGENISNIKSKSVSVNE